MRRDRHHTSQNGGAAPAIPGFTAVAPEWIDCGAAEAAPAIPAAESTLGSHPCVALSSAQVRPEWNTSTLPVNAFAANGNNPLNSVSRSRGSLQVGPLSPFSPSPFSPRLLRSVCQRFTDFAVEDRLGRSNADVTDHSAHSLALCYNVHTDGGVL